MWVANLLSPECIRVLEGGKVTDCVKLTQGGFACALGGEDGRTLYVCTAKDSNSENCAKNKLGCIEEVRVEHAGCLNPH